MKKILGLTVAALLVMGLVGGGTWAYFSDVETSEANVFTAGTLDLTPDTPGAFVTELTNLAPAVDNIAQSIDVTNSGSIDGAEMDLDINITGAEGVADGDTTSPDGTGTDMTNAEFAEALRVDTLTWKTVDLLPLVTEDGGDGNTYKDLAEVASADFSDQAGLTATEIGTLVLDVTLDPDDDYGNDPQGDGVEIEVVFDLGQVAD